MEKVQMGTGREGESGRQRGGGKGGRKRERKRVDTRKKLGGINVLDTVLFHHLITLLSSSALAMDNWSS